MQYKGIDKENIISILVWKLSPSFHFTVRIKVYCESFGFSNTEHFLRRKAPCFKQYGETGDKIIFILYNQHILPVTRVQFFIMHYCTYYKCTSVRFWKYLAYKHIQSVYLWIQGSLYFTVSFYHLNSQY